MENIDGTVVGVFMEREEAVREIQRLHNQGYRQADINVYSNPERARTVERLMGINVEDVDTTDVETAEDDSWWNTIKNSFQFFVYDADAGNNRIRSVDEPKEEGIDPVERENQISSDSTLLEPYAKDLAEGKLVIAVRNYGSHGHAN